ncbi:MAG: hypothetical protein B6D79_05455 [gamma proteobacterium symbiont of Ctena orbiculata]|nr:MAG: hypothetical protein B6D79_05455 [gamma proteobacterium symbiont of Ctena orbiculata]
MKVISTAHRVVKPHATIGNISFILERHAQENEHGSTLFRIAGLVMEAFFIEGYSTVVAINLPNTDELLNISGTKDRIKTIFKSADPSADFGKRPYQSIINLFKFRDSMAHPSKEMFNEEKELSLEDARNISIKDVRWNLTTDTEKFCTLDNSLLIREDVMKVIERTWHNEWKSYPLDSGMLFVSHKPKGE